MPVPRRYLLEETLGQGGMGAVYRVRDTETGNVVALKRLLLESGAGGSSTDADHARSELFRREYHTLAQLAHPGVIEVFDYGVDEYGPYYTMELLEGADLTQLAPVPWERACTIVRDIASCLALLHSRHLVHRDVSPGNVRCGEDGRAKLIDFGAMSQMGVAGDIMGTPPCVPPEALQKQPLDPRSDLYSLGAVLYFALTRKHAYPVRGLRELPEIWKTAPVAPSERVEGIPAALDQLALSLLSPDPNGRSHSAAEVIDRIEAIAEVPARAHVDVARAYLATPMLVDREPMLETFRSLLERADGGRGSAVVVEAGLGLGRSRLLDAFVLEAKLSGAVVLTAGVIDAATGAFGMARAWVDALLLAVSKSALRLAAPYAGTLGHVFPDLHERLGRPELESFRNENERTLRVQADLLDWLRAVSRHHRVVCVADDLHRADPESAALLVGVADSAPSSRLVVVASVEADSSSPISEAVRLLRSNATLFSLTPLSSEATQALLGSIFGSSPRLEALADWMHRQSAGSPLLCMEIATHLLEQRHVRHEGGAWVLPENPGALDVPTALEEMLARRLSALSPDARILAEVCALASTTGPLESREYASLLEGDDATARAHAAAAELCAREVLVPVGTGHIFTQPGFVQVLRAELSGSDRRRCHAALARAYEARANVPIDVAYHLQEAGEDARALEWLLGRGELASDSLAHRRSAVVARSLERALAEAKRQARSPREQMKLLRGLIDCASHVDAELGRYADELISHLRRDTGLEIWERLDPEMPSVERTRVALERAWARYDDTPEALRGLPPGEAVASLGTALTRLNAVFARCRDVRGASAVPALLEPFASLSPSAAFMFDVLRFGVRRMAGRDGGDRYRALADRAREEIPGLDPNARVNTGLTVGYYAALCTYYESTSDWVLAMADALERAPMFEALAWQVRLQHHLARGNAVEIAACRRQRDLAQVRIRTTSQHAITGARMELVMAGRFNDLMQLKSLLEPLDAEAATYPGWRPIARQAHGEYHYARADWEAARAHLEAALEASAPGELAWWSDIMARCLETMIHQGEAAAASERGCRALEEAEKNEVDWLELLSLRLAVGLAHVAAGQHDEGFVRIEAVRRDVAERGVLDLYAGSADTLARAALWADDRATFEQALGEVAELCRPGQYPPLLAKLERLAEEGRRRFGIGDDAAPEQLKKQAQALSLVAFALGVEESRQERAARAIALLLRESGAEGAFLFGVRDGELVWLGSHDGRAPSEAIEGAVREYFEAETDTAAEKTLSVAEGDDAETVWPLDGRVYRPAFLACPWNDEPCVAGVVVLEAGEGSRVEAPAAVLAALAEHLAGAGDTSPVPWLDL